MLDIMPGSACRLDVCRVMTLKPGSGLALCGYVVRRSGRRGGRPVWRWAGRAWSHQRGCPLVGAAALMEPMLGSACRPGYAGCCSGEPHGDYPEARVLDGVSRLPFVVGMVTGRWADFGDTQVGRRGRASRGGADQRHWRRLRGAAAGRAVVRTSVGYVGHGATGVEEAGAVCRCRWRRGARRRCWRRGCRGARCGAGRLAP